MTHEVFDKAINWVALSLATHHMADNSHATRVGVFPGPISFTACDLNTVFALTTVDNRIRGRQRVRERIKVEGIITNPALHVVIACSTGNRVVTLSTNQSVITLISRERVISVSAIDIIIAIFTA